jgi:hypothetical protein
MCVTYIILFIYGLFNNSQYLRLQIVKQLDISA